MTHHDRMLEDLTGVNARQIPLDDPDTMSIFVSSKVLGFENDELLGPTGAVAIPEFNTRFTRGMLMDTLPKTSTRWCVCPASPTVRMCGWATHGS